jgi:Xaa-Pro aminopeptidase
MKKLSILLVSLTFIFSIGFSQQEDGLPSDYLTKEFHAARREALRKLMPDNSVTVIFAYPGRIFSKDVNYPYHPNPDLYYFSGYKEPNAVLLIFKEPQISSGKTNYQELFFIQKKDPLQEKWTGKRMGIENVKLKLGFDSVFNGDSFNNYPIDFSKFDKIIFDGLPEGLQNDPEDNADLSGLVKSFRQKASIPPDFDNEMNGLFGFIAQRVTIKNLPEITGYVKERINRDEKFKNDPLINEFAGIKDSSGLKAYVQKLGSQKLNTALYTSSVGSLREIKTPEEMDLLRKSIEISCIAHAEVMKAIQPGMSELELQGIHEYIHKKYGAEYVGYPSIIGAGNNGCTLHYEENTRTRIGTDMVLMDVGAEYHGYSADVTRTVPVSGKFNLQQKQIYDLVYQAQEAVFKLCKEGTPFNQLNAKATGVLADGLLKLGIIKEKKDVGIYYPHGCSHHLGLDVHDKSNYGDLKQNMVITVEPGIYIPQNSSCDKKWWGIAVRIEDDVRIGKDSCELLSWAAPRKSEDVERKVGEKSILNEFDLPDLKPGKKAF